MFYCGISLWTTSAVTGLASLLFNKTVNGFNSKIEKKPLSSDVKFIKIVLHSLEDIII